LHFAHLSVPLASPNVLSFGNEKKNELFFCISLTYSYLCTVIRIFTILLTLILTLNGQAATKKEYPGGKVYMFRISLNDKLNSPYTLDNPTQWLSQKSIKRRERQGLQLDSTDLPVSPLYLKTIRAIKGIAVVGKSRWNNTVVIRTADTLTLKSVRQLPFVRKTELVWISPDSIEVSKVKYKVHETFNPWDSVSYEPYGHGREQIEILNGHRLHDTGLRGQDMTIAVLDGGFLNANVIPALKTTKIEGFRNLIWQNPKLVPSDEADNQLFKVNDHGTRVLSAMSADTPYVLVGTAPKAHYWLLACEDMTTEQPVEEDYWAMAAEVADSAGADIINSSLGYHGYDAPHRNLKLSDLDGQTTLISRTASMLAAKGIILVNSAGNTGMGPWKKICVPADAHEILTVGAINAQGDNAPFSAVGPSQDGRIKPDVTAMGSPAALIAGSGAVVRDMGTSFSAPIVCGLVACLWQAFPNKSAIDIINLVRKSADNNHAPDNVYGYGKPDFWKAYMIGKLEEGENNEE